QRSGRRLYSAVGARPGCTVSGAVREGDVEAHDRKPERPAQGGRGSWSYGPIARVSPSTRATPATSQPEPAAPPARGAPCRPPPVRSAPPVYRQLPSPTRGGFVLPNPRRNV